MSGRREDARLTADVVALAYPGGVAHVLLIRRAFDPHAGLWALPGGHVDPGERVEHAAARELTEETGLTAAGLELVGVYSDPGRDPRGRYVTFAYRTYLPDMPPPTAADDAAAAHWLPVADALDHGLAFDHAQILTDALTEGDPMRAPRRTSAPAIVTSDGRRVTSPGGDPNRVIGAWDPATNTLSHICRGCGGLSVNRGLAFRRGIRETHGCGTFNDVYTA